MTKRSRPGEKAATPQTTKTAKASIARHPDMVRLETFATATHGADGGIGWLGMTAAAAALLRAMTDVEAAEWCGVPVAQIQAIRQQGRWR